MINSERIIDSINVGIITIDENLSVYYMNTWFALHSDVDAHAVEGKSLLELFALKPEHITSLKRPRFIRQIQTGIFSP